MAKRADKQDEIFIPNTPYQRWLWPKLDTRGLTVADLARLIGKDYNYVWKIAKGDPSQNEGGNNVQSRPGFAIAAAIGAAVGDTAGSMEAAGYQLEQMFGGRLVTIQTPGGPVCIIVPNEYTPDMQRTLALLVESSLDAMRRVRESENSGN